MTGQRRKPTSGACNHHPLTALTLQKARGSACLPYNPRQVSIIEMSDDATVVRERAPSDQALLSYLKARMYTRACYHGNYLPALDAALELMKEDAGRSNQLFLVFLSDGAPSDHTEMACPHGVQVWQPDPKGGTFGGKPALRKCLFNNNCRWEQGCVRVCCECVLAAMQRAPLVGVWAFIAHAVHFQPNPPSTPTSATALPLFSNLSASTPSNRQIPAGRCCTGRCTRRA